MKINKERTLMLGAALLLLPLFFRLSGSIYNDSLPLWDSGGDILNVPLPVSIVVCFAGIGMLMSNYRQAMLAATINVSMFAAMTIAFIFSGTPPESYTKKAILMLQFLLPVSGLLLGQLVVDERKTIPKAFFYTIAFIVPLQLVSGWLRGGVILNHNLFLFGIYQHLEFVPHVLICAFVFSMVSLWDSHKKVFYFFIPLMFVYAVSSGSFLAIFLYSAMLYMFGYFRIYGAVKAKHVGYLALFASVGILILVGGLHWYSGKLQAGHDMTLGFDATSYLGKFDSLASGKLPLNVEERFEIWDYYLSAIAESTRTLALGHPASFPRNAWSSAHNWYLDMIYNFGLISLIPIGGLITYTGYQLWRRRATLPNEVLWLGGIVFYMVLIDNSFKVTLRQPYPGIFAYFVWGVLLTGLAQHQKNSKPLS